MDIKLLAVDVDGTLLNSNSVLTQSTSDILIEMQQRGICLVLCSGRPLYMLKPLADRLKMKDYGGFLVGENGNAVCDLAKDEISYYHPLSPQIIYSIYEKMKRHCIYIAIEGNHVTYIKEHLLYTLFSRIKNRLRKKSEKTDCYPVITDNYKKLVNVCEITDDMNKIIVYHFPFYIPEIKKKIEKMNFDVSVLQVHKFSLEIQDKKSDKLFGLTKIAENLKITSGEIMAIGDGENDIGMIRYAKIGCAMKNALTSVKDAADVILDDNDHDGVAKGVVEYIFNHKDSQSEKNNV